MADVTITPSDNGPYLVAGPIKVVDATGAEFTVKGEVIAFCRCGHSDHKPFCDGTHRKVGFKSEPRAQKEAGA